MCAALTLQLQARLPRGCYNLLKFRLVEDIQRAVKEAVLVANEMPEVG